MPACHAGGRGFESRPDRHFIIWLGSSVGRARPNRLQSDTSAYQLSHSLNKLSEMGRWRTQFYIENRYYIWLGSSVGRAMD